MRWIIGLSLVTIFTAVSFGATTVAVMQAMDARRAADAAPQASDYPWPLDSAALAVVLDIDSFDENDQLILHLGDVPIGYTMVDIRFKHWAEYEGDSEIAVVSMDWDPEEELPDVGDQLAIRHRSGDPEYAPQLVGSTNADPDLAAPPFPTSVGPRPGTPASVRWTIAVSGLLALIALGATAIWAGRAAPTAAVSRSPAGWTPPPPPQYQYPEPEYSQPQNPLPEYPQSQNPLPEYSHPQYSRPQNPQPEYSRPQYPQPEYPRPPQSSGLTPPG